MGMWVGRGRKARAAYGFDDIALVPGALTINPNEVDVSWELCGRRFDIPIHVRSSFSAKEGTIVTDHPAQGDTVEAPIIAGVAHDRSEAKITVVGVPDHPGKAAEIFQTCADAQMNIDMIVQNVSAIIQILIEGTDLKIFVYLIMQHQ